MIQSSYLWDLQVRIFILKTHFASSYCVLRINTKKIQGFVPLPFDGSVNVHCTGQFNGSTLIITKKCSNWNNLLLICLNNMNCFNFKLSLSVLILAIAIIVLAAYCAAQWNKECCDCPNMSTIATIPDDLSELRGSI